ncbi:putative short-chain dehydrogenase [Pleomassaria siparia CBS 279.74]|uniref:Putative short-chain dehydrogenase n=1 Tax=Pleomassaria siparia CBS 279.74 TaxID=1314801 RepID=A0A6G1KK24_9PLEO|nr:putative short-chain dehydrogenase [Pleomassaria siparia CBS 279.74]
MSGPSLSAVVALMRSQLLTSIPTPTTSFAGETVIVTGANAGLGRETAKHIVRLGASKVILAVRTISKGEDARAYIEEQTKRTGVVEVWPLDMSTTPSIQTFAKRAEGLDRLDAVVLNAGIMPMKTEMIEGNEATITINVINTFLLAHLLLPTLQKTSITKHTITRLTVVNSALHKFATLKARASPAIFPALASPSFGPKDYDMRYMDSKLLVLLYIRALAAAVPLSGSNLVCDSVNPGYCYSGLHGPNPPLKIRISQSMTARSTDTGACTLVDSVKPVGEAEAKERHGAYVDDCKVKKGTPWLETKDGKETQERVWNELNAMLEGIETGVTNWVWQK